MSFKLPWTSSSKATNNDEPSLDNVLPTAALRTELLLLVVLITDRMRDNFTAPFESRSSNAARNPNDVLLLDESDTSIRGRPAVDQASRLQLFSGSTKQLRQQGVEYFNTWRTALLRRMGEALSVRPDVVKQAKAKYLSTRDARDKAARYQEYLEWAEGSDERVRRDSTLETSMKIETSLLRLDEKQRALILSSCLFMLLSLEKYSAHSRTLLVHICDSLNLPVDVLSSSESTLAVTLLKSASTTEIKADDARQKKADENAAARKWKIGLATVGGAVLVGVTGGLAAPLLLGAAGAIMGGVGLGGLATLLGATIANPVTIAALFGAFGGRMSGNAMEKFAKDVEDFRLVRVRRSASAPASPTSSAEAASQKLRVVIGISGWLLDEADVTEPWRVFSSDSFEPFALQYERSALIELGTGLDGVLRNSAYSLAQAGAMQVVLPAISAVLLPVSLLKVGQFLDNPFSIAMERSDKAGKVLATALIAKAQGERPVTLVGYSLGARLIYSCLQELAARQSFGLVENIVLIGSPIPSNAAAWELMRAMVTGRVVNVYTDNDLLLGYLYRTRNAQPSVAGLQAVQKVPGVENANVTHFVKGHNQYRLAIGRILRSINFQDLYASEVDKEEAELEAENAKEQQTHHKAKQGGQLKNQEDDDGRIIMVDTNSQNDKGHAGSGVTKTNRSVEQDLMTESMAAMNVSSRPESISESRAISEQQEASDDEVSKEDFRARMIHMDPEPEPEPEAVLIKKKERKGKPANVVTEASEN